MVDGTYYNQPQAPASEEVDTAEKGEVNVNMSHMDGSTVHMRKPTMSDSDTMN